MALIACPECHQQMSDKAVSCPHCGFPNPATTNAFDNLIGESPEQVADQVREALKQAGFTGTTFSDPFIKQTTRVFSGKPMVVSSNHPIPNVAQTPVRYTGYGFEYKSKWNLFGLPLICISQGYDSGSGKKRVACGVIAIGDVAVGGLAIGGFARGIVAVGGGAIGLIAFGGLAIGGIALGGGAIGFFALGGAAAGAYAIGGGAFSYFPVDILPSSPGH